MRQPATAPRVLWPRLAGLVLVFDGVLALLSAVAFLYLTLFPPVAAIQGQPAIEQSWLGQAALALAMAVAALWAGQRALRAVRRGRLVGVVIAGAIVAAVLYVFASAPSFGAGDAAIGLGIVAVHALAAVALLGWPEPGRGR